MPKTRVVKWDNIKFVLILAVAFGHLATYYTGESQLLKALYFFIYIFHMPAFVFISGLLMKSTINNKRYDKVFPYLILGFLIKAINLVAGYIGGRGVSFSVFDENSVAWYAFAIFVFALATMFLKQFNQTHIFLFLVAVGILAGYDDSIGTMLSLSRIFVFFPFFYAGYVIDTNKLLEVSKNIWLKIVSAIALIATAIIVYLNIDSINWLTRLTRSKYAYCDLKHLSNLGGALRFGQYIIAFALTFALIIIIPNIKSFCTTLGGRTLSIFALHTAVIYILRGVCNLDSIMERISPNHYAYLVFIIVPMIVVFTGLKPFHFVINKIISPKKMEEKSND